MRVCRRLGRVDMCICGSFGVMTGSFGVETGLSVKLDRFECENVGKTRVLKCTRQVGVV